MLIGVTGYAQHGKDTVANYLVREHGFARVGFADQLKNLAWGVNPYIPSHHGGLRGLVDVEGWEAAKGYAEVRRFLQELGTQARYHLGENVWVDALARRYFVGGDLADEQNVVIPDVRFPNEAEFITEEGGILLGVHRVNEDGTYFENGVGTEHESERYIPALLAQCEITFTAADVETLERMVGYYMEYNKEALRG